MIADDLSLELDYETGEDPRLWVLDTFVEQWPGTEFPDVVERFNRDDSESIDTGVRSGDFDLEEGVSVGAALADDNREPIATSFSYDVETTISVRVEGLHQDQYGHIESSDAFRQFIDALKEALRRERAMPSIDGGAYHYHTLLIENETDNSADGRDYYHATWDVRIKGRELRDD